MPNLVVLGVQWGDEGKGKIVDLLCERFDAVVRFQGGANAGHTVVVGGEQFILHQAPTGLLRGVGLNVIGNGVVVDPAELLTELGSLEERFGALQGRLAISDRAQLVMPYHRDLDRWSEERRGAASIGTTGKGIGPAYEYKASREGLRVGDLLDPQMLAKKIEGRLARINETVRRLFDADPYDSEKMIRDFIGYGEALAPYVDDTVQLLNRRIAAGDSILFEGAQGTMLDIDHGTYPFVTSSNTTVGGVCAGSGVPPKHIHGVLGVVKVYATRVGEGPFPTEEKGRVGQELRERGGEFGATTGRPRRCGWFDAVAVRRAVQINGIDALAMTKLDVLDRLREIPVCVGYQVGGRAIDGVPATVEEYEKCEPDYERRPGWRSDTSGVSSFEELPEGARNYIDHLSGLVGVPVAIISTGSERSHTILRDDVLGDLPAW